MTLPVSGFYSNVMNSYFGYMTPTDQEDLWQLFKQNYNLGATTISDTDPLIQAEFVHFVQGIYQKNNDMQSEVLLSPNEVQKRQILFDTFDIVLKMLNTVQTTIGVQGTNLIFYGNWQEEYTKMLTKVPLYIDSPDNRATINTTDASRFTLGFNNISVQEVAEYVASTGNQASFELFSNGYSSSTGDTSVYVNFRPDSFDIKLVARNEPTVLYDSGFITTSITPGATVTETANNLSQAFLQKLGANLDSTFPPYSQIPSGLTVTNFISTDPLVGGPASGVQTSGVPWKLAAVTVTDDATRDANNAITQTRGEVNARNQQLIENIRSKRQVLLDQSKIVQSNLSDSKEALSQLSDLLTSMLETLKTLSGAIAK